MKGHKYNKALFAPIGIVSLTILSGVFLISSKVMADDADVVDQINITVPVSCTMSGTGMNTHNAEINNNTYTPNIGTTTLHAFCNDNNGFAIYAAGYTGDEIGGENSTKLVGTQSGIGNIATGTAENGSTSNWAMKLAITQDSGDMTGTNAVAIDNGFNNYHAVPAEYTKVAHKNTSTDMTESTGGVKLTTTYAAFISQTQPAGTYAGQVIYTLVHPASHAAPVLFNTSADHISEVTYLQEFAKVSDENRDLIIASMVPEQQYTLQDSRDGKSYTIARFYASDYGEDYQQTMTYLSSCLSVSGCDEELLNGLSSEWIAYSNTCRLISYSKTFCDETLHPSTDRGVVWMTKNLDLNLDSGVTYTNEDTDIGYNSATNSYGAASWSPVRSTYQANPTQTHEWCQDGNWNSEYARCEYNSTPESLDPGNFYWNGIEERDYEAWNEYYETCDFSTPTLICDSSKSPISNYISTTGTAQYHLGNYYNLTAALATNDMFVYGSELIDQSICPAGWTLPRKGDGEDTIYSLWGKYGFGVMSFNDQDDDWVHDANENALWDGPLYFVPGGTFDSAFGNVGSSGHYRLSALNDYTVVKGATFNVDRGVATNVDVDQALGLSIRCILRPVTNIITNEDGGGSV